MDFLLQDHIPFKLLFLASVRPETLSAWESALKSDPLAPYGFTAADLVVGPIDPARKQVFARFPNMHPFGYIPDLPQFAWQSGEWQNELRYGAAQLGISGQDVIFFYGVLAPAVRLNIDDLLNLRKDLAAGSQDVIICTPDYQRVICRTFDDDWFCGCK